MTCIDQKVAPVYRGQPQPTGYAGLLSGLWCDLFGGGRGTPAYKTVGGTAQAAPPARCWWQVLAPTPSYKTAPVAPAASTPDLAVPSPDDTAEYGYVRDGVPIVIL